MVTASSTAVEFASADGALRLHAEINGAPQAPLTVLCLHGLTRNGKDFGALVSHLSGRYQIITADQRGRGKSQWDANPANYRPREYARDMFHLLDHLDISRVALVGTSMGGIVSMIMAAAQPRRVRALVLNDIGPEVPAAGLSRLRASLNTRADIVTWQDAARHARHVNGLAFPDYGPNDWDSFAQRTYAEDASGRPVSACDPAVLEGLNRTELYAAPDLWPVWAQLGAIPALAIRGELSDILTANILAAMAARHPNLRTASIPHRGHAPMLDEPKAVAAIDVFLDGLAP